MPVTITPTDLTSNNNSVERDTSFSFNISVSATGMDVIESIAVTSSSPDVGVTISVTGTSTATVSGSYTEQFTDEIHYMEPGTTNRTATVFDADGNPTGERDLTDAEFAEQKLIYPSMARPTVVIGTGNVPPGKQIIKLNNDRTGYKDVTYTVAVTTTINTYNETIDHRVTNGGAAAMNWLTSYLPTDLEV
tara:strand:+ start:1664 stop:2236 length:573 start_codon:yes stop_codon:yes gene_type:complete